MFKLVDGVLVPVLPNAEARGPVTAALIESGRVIAFYYDELFGCHVSEMECGLTVLHGF